MKERHDEDKKRLQQKLDGEAKQKETDGLKGLERERTKVLTEKRNKQAAELAARRDLSEEEMQQVSLDIILKFYTNVSKNCIIVHFNVTKQEFI